MLDNIPLNTTNIILITSTLLACVTELFPTFQLSYWLPPSQQLDTYFAPWAAITRFLTFITIWVPLRARIFILSGQNMIIHMAIRYALALSFISRFSAANQDQLKWLALGYVLAFFLICYVLWSPWPLMVIVGGILISWSGRRVCEEDESFVNAQIQKTRQNSEYIQWLDYMGRIILCSGFIYMTSRLLITSY